MKRKLYILGFISISFLIFSCTNDEDVIQENRNPILKLNIQNEFEKQTIESTIDNTAVVKSEMVYYDGEPDNPKPR